jgi:hypothetical protein
MIRKSFVTAVTLGFFAFATAFAVICSAPPAIAAHEGNWLMVAVTKNGHCGQINIGLGIKSGRIYSTGGAFVRHPIQVDGRVSASGQAKINAVAGPRIAHGTGRFTSFRGSGTWTGNGPSGVCSGVWSAFAVKSVPSFGRKRR